MIRLFKNELCGNDYRSFVMVDVNTNKFTLYREYKGTGRIEIIMDGDLSRLGWMNVNEFIKRGAGNRIEVSYESQKMREHVNYVTQLCLLRDEYQNAKDEFSKKRIQKMIERHVEDSEFFGLSRELAGAFCIKQGAPLYGQEANYGFRTGENYRRERGNQTGVRRGGG